jgi:hypothetical protein
MPFDPNTDMPPGSPLVTSKERKRALSSPAVDIQSEAMDGVQRNDGA